MSPTDASLCESCSELTCVIINNGSGSNGLRNVSFANFPSVFGINVRNLVTRKGTNNLICYSEIIRMFSPNKGRMPHCIGNNFVVPGISGMVKPKFL